MTVQPYSDNHSSKKTQVTLMFDNISRRYDFLNHFLSLGIDRYWRKKTVNFLKNKEHNIILDVATGTGDLAIAAYKVLKSRKITGIDISEKMLEIGKKKIATKYPQAGIELMAGDSEKLNFGENLFDAVLVAFGVRNFENLEKGLNEIHRVLKPEGWFVMLEFSKPAHFPVKQLYGFYFKNILPVIGKMFSKDSGAYKYLPKSVNEFPEREHFLEYLRKSGFIHCSFETLTFGIASIYTGQKKW